MKPFFLLCLASLGLCLSAHCQTQGTTEKATRAEPTKSAPPLEMDIPVAGQDLTITESARIDGLTPEDIGQNYNFAAIGEDLSEAIENYENAQNTPRTDAARAHLRDVVIGFILEVLITLAVLQVAFSLSGFPVLFRQIALLSLAIALAGAALHYFLHVGLLNPIRIGVGFILLLVLIRQMTDVREWATAIRIALLARLISLGLMWLALAGVMGLVGL